MLSQGISMEQLYPLAKSLNISALALGHPHLQHTPTELTLYLQSQCTLKAGIYRLFFQILNK